MATLTFDKKITALLVVDPYNDFISDGGKIWNLIKGVAEANKCVPNMLKVLNAARQAGLRVFYALHHRYRPGDYETWKYIAPIQKRGWASKVFEYGTWGGEIRDEFKPKAGEIVAEEHWCSSGFANTDLDLQLKKHGIHKLIVIGLIAHTCVEATVRYTSLRNSGAQSDFARFHNLSSSASILCVTSVASLSKLMATGDIVGARIRGLDLCCRTGRVLPFNLKARHEKRLLDSCIQVHFG